jgi:hypothetical protein
MKPALSKLTLSGPNTKQKNTKKRQTRKHENRLIEHRYAALCAARLSFYFCRVFASTSRQKKFTFRNWCSFNKMRVKEGAATYLAMACPGVSQALTG